MLLAKRKVRKLFRVPKKFAVDFIRKRRMNSAVNRSYNYNYETPTTFTVISAVYNVSSYLDDYFKSLVNQTLSFENNIELILIDDGSTDISAEIIKSWVKKYPNNIHYFYKKNGGQASARNIGISKATGAWVTFIDPDDFVCKKYFQEIDVAISSCDDGVNVVAARPIFFDEEQNSVIPRKHALDYRFENGGGVYDLMNNPDYYTMSAATAFFRNYKNINDAVFFDKELKPNYEDGRYVAEYLLNRNNYKINYCSGACYYNRKRSERNSTVDTMFLRKEKYSTVIDRGYLKVIEHYKSQLGFVPDFIQRSLIDDISLYFSNLTNSDEKLNFLTSAECDEFEDKLHIVFSYISESNIKEHKLKRMKHYLKNAAVYRYKGVEQIFNRGFVECYDRKSSLLEIKVYSPEESPRIEVKRNGLRVPLYYRKKNKFSFVSRPFYYAHIFTIKLDDFDHAKLFINEIHSPFIVNQDRIRIGSKQLFQDKIVLLLNKIREYLLSGGDYYSFIDRSDRADDNAEHLYKWFRENTNERIRFILSKKSKDWDRLEREGFRLVSYGSVEHMLLLFRSRWLISSQLGSDAEFLARDKFSKFFNYKFAFLQHGVIKDNLDDYLNRHRVDVMLTSTIEEFQSILDGNNYLTEKQLVLTGLPRHDSLISYSNRGLGKKIILVMPTWRKHLVGGLKQGSLVRERVDCFEYSEFYNRWNGFITCEALLRKCRDENIKIRFILHDNMSCYKELFVGCDCVDVLRLSDVSIQSELAKASMLLTDYSSIAFEMSVLRKPIVYYQFDVEDFFSSHTYKEGYFSYQRDGFGEVLDSECDLVDAVLSYANSDFKMKSLYFTRSTKSMCMADGRACSRVYSEIKNRENISNDSVLTPNLLCHKIDFVINNMPELYDDNKLSSIYKYVDNEIRQYQFISSLLRSGRLKLAKSLLSKDNGNLIAAVEYNALMGCMHRSLALLSKIECSFISIPKCIEHVIISCVKTKELSRLKKIIEINSEFFNYDPIVFLMLIDSMSCFLEKKYSNAILIANTGIGYGSSMFDIIKAKAYRKSGDYKQSEQYLMKYERDNMSDVFCRLEIAALAFDCGNYKKAEDQLFKGYSKNISNMPRSAIKILEQYREHRILNNQAAP